MPQERRRALFRGRVQGVGFRATAHHLARGFDVSGFVRNLHDGRVEVVAQGDAAELDAFLKAIQREFGPKIHGVDFEPIVSDDSLSGFSIRY
jgi:acylphosphatase